MKLLEQATIAKLRLKNRMVMSAMTRSRADINGVVGDLTVQYYTQRAGAGMIITEAVNISEQAIGSPFTPGLFTGEQINAWRKVTNAVHEKGGTIIAQLWHTGRVGHSIDRKGVLPFAPSAIPITGMQHFTSQGVRDYETPQELSIAEIKQTIKDYALAAKHAMEAGFDGVELHAANGYLPHQFLAESANGRTDAYGGSIPNNARFVLEVMQALIDAVGGEHVGIKISPFHPYGAIILDNPVATYTYLIGELNKMDFAFVELMKRSPMYPPVPGYPEDDEIALFGKMIRQTVIANTGYDKDTATAELRRGIAAFVSFGVLFLANPDLPERFEKNTALNQPDRATMFGGDERGYTDYPFMGG